MSDDKEIDKAIEDVAYHFDCMAQKIRDCGVGFKKDRKTYYLEDIITSITWGIANARIEMIFSKLFRLIERNK